jgi:hypothetical protein
MGDDRVVGVRTTNLKASSYSLFLDTFASAREIDEVIDTSSYPDPPVQPLDLDVSSQNSDDEEAVLLSSSQTNNAEEASTYGLPSLPMPQLPDKLKWNPFEKKKKKKNESF